GFAADGRRSGCVSQARVTLTNARRFAAQRAQIIKLCASDMASLHHVNVIDDPSVQRKDSFDAYAKAGLAHRDRFARAAVFAGDADAFKSLQTLFGFGFLDAHV